MELRLFIPLFLKKLGLWLAFSLLSSSCSLELIGDLSSVNKNLPPLLTVNTGATLVEADPALVLQVTDLQVTDDEQEDSEITYKITAVPTFGSLQKDNVDMAINDTFTQAELSSGSIAYLHGASYVETGADQTDQFEFSYTDGISPEVTGNSFSFTIKTFCFDKTTATEHDEYIAGANAPVPGLYYICTAAQNNDIGDPAHYASLDNDFMLRADIDYALIPQPHNVIGDYSSVSSATTFRGNYDGHNHTITGFTHNDLTRDYIGLFGYVEGGLATNRYARYGTISNLTLQGVGIRGRDYVGALMGRGLRAVVRNVHVEGEISSGGAVGSDQTGGLVGSLTFGVLEQCIADVDLTASGNLLGGLVGEAVSSFILRSQASGNVTGGLGTSSVGGLIGSSTSYVLDSYATGNVSANFVAGGLIGLATSSSVRNSYATGDVFADTNAGGLIGQTSDVSVNNSYSRGDVTADANAGGFIGSWSSAGTAGLIQNYSSGRVTGTTNTGGFIGVTVSAVTPLSLNLWDSTSSGTFISAGDDGVMNVVGRIESRTTVQMQTETTFTAYGWDLMGEVANGREDYWAAIPVNTYPVQWYESSTADASPFDAGDGTEANPYLISTASQLNAITTKARYMHSHFKLTADIDLTAVTFAPIGLNALGSAIAFVGTIDGDGHTVSNLTHNFPANVSGGFISYLGGAGTVKNLKLVDVIITASGIATGALVGNADPAVTISNCSVDGGSVTSTANRTGGLVGSLTGGYIAKSYAAVTVNGPDFSGGLVGRVRGMGVAIANSASHGDVISTAGASGGFIGGVDVSAGALIINSFSSSFVSAPGTRGGFVGSSGVGNTYIDNHWDTTTSSQANAYNGSAGSLPGQINGAATAVMYTEANYTNWDFTRVWEIAEGLYYPTLR